MKANETIVDRIVERLKQSAIGDLITEEDLHEIIKDAIPKVFFEKRQERVTRGYHTEDVVKEPAIYEILRELLKDQVEKEVKAWIADNNELVAEFWGEVMTSGIRNYVRTVEDKEASALIRKTLEPWLKDINEQRAAHGLGPIYI